MKILYEKILQQQQMLETNPQNSNFGNLPPIQDDIAFQNRPASFFDVLTGRAPINGINRPKGLLGALQALPINSDEFSKSYSSDVTGVGAVNFAPLQSKIESNLVLESSDSELRQNASYQSGLKQFESAAGLNAEREGGSSPRNRPNNDEGNDSNKKSGDRGLTNAEKELIPRCIRVNIDLDRVVIKDAKSIGARNNIVTRGWRIYWPDAPKNIAGSGALNEWVLVHEVTHVWQYKALGYTIPSFFGRDYWYDLNEHENLRDFDAEQMASIVADYSYIRRGRKPRRNRGTITSTGAYARLVTNCMRK